MQSFFLRILIVKQSKMFYDFLLCTTINYIETGQFLHQNKKIVIEITNGMD